MYKNCIKSTNVCFYFDAFSIKSIKLVYKCVIFNTAIQPSGEKRDSNIK